MDGQPIEIASSKDVVISCDPGINSGDWSSIHVTDLKMQFEIKGTHKNQRQLRALRKTLNIHKPRLPRKYKKRLKKLINGLERVHQTIKR